MLSEFLQFQIPIEPSTIAGICLWAFALYIGIAPLREGITDGLEAWMNWATPTGLMTPAPEGITFMGGTNDAPAGSTQYFEVDLSPGNYAFISEVPNSKAKGMLKTFKVE